MHRNPAYLRHPLHGTSHSQHPLMNAGDDFADTSLDAGLFPEFSDILASFADDNPSVLGADEGTELQRAVERGRLRLG